MSRTQTPSHACPCGKPLAYADCCGRYHTGPQTGLAPDPESLMRSRYSAFVKDLRPYLLDTWHPDHRPTEIEAPEAGLNWLGLSVRSSRVLSDSEGLVDFVARYKIGGRAHRLEELSRFVRLHGRWYYVCAHDESA